MVNSFRAIDGRLGIKLGQTDATPQHRGGDRVKGNDGSEWMYVQASAAGTIAQYAVVAVQAACTAAPVTHALARGGHTIGVAQNAFAAGEYGWVALNGQNLTINVLGSCAAGVTLYTTDTAGALDDATASGSAGVIYGLTLTVANGGATASSALAEMRNPVTRKTLVDA